MDLDGRTEKLAALMEERLGIRGRGFEAKLARAGRRLPKRLRREAARLVEARALAAHPRLSRRVDRPRLERAAAALERYLGGVDTKERQTTQAVNWLAGTAFNLLIVFGLALSVMVLRGLV